MSLQKAYEIAEAASKKKTDAFIDAQPRCQNPKHDQLTNY